MSEKKPLYQSPGEMGKRGSEQALNGFMAYVRRQRAGFQEYGDKRIGESQTDYDATLFDEESS